jgi:uncharacterized protein YabN with tetrapyrrole methylase and pyrophosphatase domain
MKESQEVVKQFNEKREWMRVHEMKDLLLNLCEETGEAWNLIKWVDHDTQKQLIEKNKDDWEDFVGDTLYLILKIASLTGVDAKSAINRTMDDYEKRFPVEKTKGSHSNVAAGGFDNKEGC